jgi:uncharacterized Zn-binding protein involved in type VI secretion
MGQPAARNSDPHVCTKPLSTSPFPPHGGGTIVAAGTSKVFINNMPAAVTGDICSCPEPGNTIMMGSNTVKFGGQGAARVLDKTTHLPATGKITAGSGNVFIGD